MSTATLQPESVHASRILEENLAALALMSPRTAERVRQSPPREGLRWSRTEQDGAWSADLEGRALASRRRPVEEGDRLAEAFDFSAHGAAVVMGFGLGYHVASLARRAGNHSLVIVYEPDVALLRSVLEHADLAPWLRAARVIIFNDPDDGAEITEALSGIEALVSLGVGLVEHVPSRVRLGDSAPRFMRTLTQVIGAMRMQVVTTMTQMQVTFRNLLMNADHYAGATGAGRLKDLEHAFEGTPAILVAAGPSLERNLHLLADPRVRERCVIIAVQTVLKPMLARGITPHFVTALDFHEISRRFYEGLTPDAVRGVTLVAEPKANPAILEAFPGRVRLCGAEMLDLFLGNPPGSTHGIITPGATVAHLSYYLARALGCDPVILIGQDLAFTDGQYYAAGAAIHEVWATECNPFNTLEMFEWQRIVRWRGHLHKTTDHLGRSVYTDDQMSTYLAQFERDFLADAARGLRTIDATEGGARKAHTTTLTLREAIDRHVLASPRPIDPAILDRHAGPSNPAGARVMLAQRLSAVQEEARLIARRSRETVALLERMPDLQHDADRLNRLIEEVHQIREEVAAQRTAYTLVHRLNQAGTFRRFRADRALNLEAELTEEQRQQRQIQRDISNVRWIADAADALDDLLSATLDSLNGAPKRTRDPAPEPASEITDSAHPARRTPRVAAVIPIDPERSLMAGRRPFEAGVLARTLARVSRCTRLDSVVLLAPPGWSCADDVARACTLPLRVHHVPIESLREAAPSIRAARLWASTCWRGGLAGLTCYDECFHPAPTVDALQAVGCDAALILGPDWSAVEPEWCDQVIERHSENPAALPLVFTQAPPGLCGCVVSAALSAKLAQGRAAADPRATIGGMLGFHPTAPRRDPIAECFCVRIPESARARHERFIADGAAPSRALEQDGDRERFDRARREGPAHLILELTADRSRRPSSGSAIALEHAETIIRQAASKRSDLALTLAGRGDPLEYPGLARLIASARAAGVAGVHVRTELIAPEQVIDALVDAEPDVISVDLHAASAPAYHALAGLDCFSEAIANVDRVLKRRRFPGGLPFPWIVPRITRRDAVYEEIEPFFDRGVYFASACVIDPLPRAIEGERIAPLPKPASLVRRDAVSRLFIRCDGAVLADETRPDAPRHEAAANAIDSSVDEAWAALVRRREEAWTTKGPSHPDLRTMP